MEIFIIFKVCVYILLAAIFFYFFGYESLHNFMKRRTIFVDSEIKFSDFHLPAITVWRIYDTEQMYDKINSTESACYNMQSIVDAFRCMEKFTANLTDTIVGVVEGPEDADINKTLVGDDLWQPSFGMIISGRQYTMSKSYHLSDSFFTRIILPVDGNFTIEIHDPHYFVENTEKLKDFPHPKVILDTDHLDKRKRHNINLDVIRNRLLADREESYCTEDGNYKFVECTKTWVSRQVGCRHPWDPYSSNAIPVCSATKDLKKFEDILFKLARNGSDKIGATTGCIKPCQYNEYKLFGSPISHPDNVMTQRNEVWVDMMLSSEKVQQRTEVWLYPPASFVAEFGGALGLCLGFSFLTAYEWVETLLKKGNKVMKTTSNGESS